MKVPFLDLLPMTQAVEREFLASAEEMLKKSHFVLSEEVAQFEAEWAAATGTKYAAGVSNGGDALYLALLALGVGEGDEVITQANAYNASVTAILRVGAVPRFVDIHPETLEMDTSRLASVFSEKTKAILPVHLYGQPANMQAVMDFAKEHNLFVVEDCAQAHGATWGGKQVGSFGDVGAFSFYPTKNLGAFGDAGVVVTNNEELHKKIAILRNLGQSKKNDHALLGYNMRLDPLQAKALSLKLPHLKAWTEARQEAARYYRELLEKLNVPVRVQAEPEASRSVYHLFVVVLPEVDRDKLQQDLREQGVETLVHYPVPVYQQPFYTGEAHSFPETELAASRILSLPFYVGITKQQQEYVIENLQKYVQ